MNKWQKWNNKISNIYLLQVFKITPLKSKKIEFIKIANLKNKIIQNFKVPSQYQVLNFLVDQTNNNKMIIIILGKVLIII